MRILFLTARFCYPHLKGDTSRVYHQLRTLGKDHDITLLSLAERPVKSSDLEHVARLCERVVVVPLPRWRVARNLAMGTFSRVPWQVHYYRVPAARRRLAALLRRGHFDLLHVTLIRMLPYVWDVGRPPVVADLIDSLGLNLAARRRQVRGVKRLAYEIEYRRVRAYERAAVERFPALIVTSEADRRALGGGDKIAVLPMGVDLERFPFHGPEGRDRATLVFTGNMGYHPNEEAVLWFASEVWPGVRAAHPEARWQIVGTGPSERVRALAHSYEGIEVLGWVPDIAGYLGRATISICPLQSGSGIQMKVQEAMAVGAPVAATPVANRGVRGVPGRDLVVAAGAQEFAAAVGALLDDVALRARLAQAGRAFVERRFRWERHAEELGRVYASVIPPR